GFFFQAEDGIRDFHVTGVQTCALPIFSGGNRYWQYQPQIQVPIFNGGLAGGLDLAEARKVRAVAEYEKAIQTAFREVADALAGEIGRASCRERGQRAGVGLVVDDKCGE